MRIVKWRAFVLGLFLLFPACLTEKSSKIEQSKITTDYVLHYDDSDESIIGEAQINTQKLSSDGSWSEPVYLELDNNSAIYFDDLMMVETKSFLDQITYRKIQSKETESRVWKEHAFRYVQNSGVTLVNTATPISFPALLFPAGIVSKSGFTFQWTLSEPIGNDSLQLIFNLNNGYPGYLVKEQQHLPALSIQGEIVVNTKELQSWTAKQSYFAQLCRVRSKTALQTPQSGGKMTIVSCSKRQAFNLDF